MKNTTVDNGSERYDLGSWSIIKTQVRLKRNKFKQNIILLFPLTCIFIGVIVKVLRIVDSNFVITQPSFLYGVVFFMLGSIILGIYNFFMIFPKPNDEDVTKNTVKYLNKLKLIVHNQMPNLATACIAYCLCLIIGLDFILVHYIGKYVLFGFSGILIGSYSAIFGVFSYTVINKNKVEYLPFLNRISSILDSISN